MGRWYDEVFADRLRLGLKVRRVLHSSRSVHQSIEILDTEQFGRTLVLDGIFQTSEADEFYYHEMLVHPAMVTAPRIARVLVIGGGDGGTVREVLRHPEVESVHMVEIDREVVEACREHLPSIGTAWNDPRLKLFFEDGVRFAHDASAGAYDVVILDGSDPVGPSKGLFDESFYRTCARLLPPAGVFAVQSETPIFYRETFLEVVRTLRRVAGSAHPYFGTVPLYGPGPWSWTVASRETDPLAIRDERAERIEPACRYYNRKIHRAAFAVPSWIRRELAREAPISAPEEDPPS